MYLYVICIYNKHAYIIVTDMPLSPIQSHSPSAPPEVTSQHNTHLSGLTYSPSTPPELTSPPPHLPISPVISHVKTTSPTPSPPRLVTSCVKTTSPIHSPPHSVTFRVKTTSPTQLSAFPNPKRARHHCSPQKNDSIFCK